MWLRPVAAVSDNLPFGQMHATQIAELLQPFVRQPLSSLQLEQIATYLDLLQKWNRKLNLTAIREEENIVTRHFGESLFAAQNLVPDGAASLDPIRAVDVGSGAGFPGLPLKLWAPQVELTMIESTQKKATFLKEAIRALELRGATVFADRAESYPVESADIVTLRAVERFDSALVVAAGLVADRGRIALLIGKPQLENLSSLTPPFSWAESLAVPLSSSRILQVGIRN